MIADKLELKRKIRRLRVERDKLQNEVSIFEAAGKEKFPYAYKALTDKISLNNGMIEGIKWVINTKPSVAKTEKKVAKSEKKEAAKSVEKAVVIPIKKEETPKASAKKSTAKKNVEKTKTEK